MVAAKGSSLIKLSVPAASIPEMAFHGRQLLFLVPSSNRRLRSFTQGSKNRTGCSQL
ncbi:hypothetical protein MPLSOD_100424 [Mesorhizobium sp. SOD10]|nr:hypothetical protein MPLSOD_100424 [Mesorhizobium sp. SOD10]